MVTVLKMLLVWAAASAALQAAPRWGPFRGANTDATLDEDGVRAFAAAGGNLLRVSQNVRPLMKRTSPYDVDETNFARLDTLLSWAEKYGVKVVIDPHTAPGTQQGTTTLPTDLFWNDASYHDHLVRLWAFIAERYKDRGAVIAGYDLLNEPALPNGGPEGTPADWNGLVRRLIATIRALDPVHTIIVEPPVIVTPGKPYIRRFEGMRYLEAPPAQNLVYSPHMYEPHDFTHQGLDGRPEPVAYPSVVKGKLWDRAAIEAEMQPALEFQQKYKVPIYIAEFSAPRYRGEDANRYVRDVIELCEKYGWSWTYHAWRGSEIWDPELNNEDRADRRRQDSTPRLDMLKSFWGRNAKPKRPGVAPGAVVNGASFRSGPVAAGEVISIFGSQLGPDELVVNSYGAQEALAGVRVLIDGVEARPVFVRADQVSAIVPESVAGKAAVDLVVEYETAGDPVHLSVAPSAPGVFTAGGTGAGEAIGWNENGARNGAANPAPRGSLLHVLATGVADGSARFGAAGAEVLQCVPAPGLPGALQLTMRVPQGAEAGPAVAFTITSAGAASQPGVTVAVE